MFAPPHSLGEALQGGHRILAVCRDPSCRHRREVDLERLIGRLGARAKLLPEPQAPHFTDRMRCPLCKRMGMFLWLEMRLVPPRTSKEPNFAIVDRGTGAADGFTMIATADNLMIGRGAYTAAALFYPERRITLQQGAFVVEDSRIRVPTPMTAEKFEQMREAERSLAQPKKL